MPGKAWVVVGTLMAGGAVVASAGPLETSLSGSVKNFWNIPLFPGGVGAPGLPKPNPPARDEGPNAKKAPLPARIDAAIEKGTAFLISKQLKDGLDQGSWPFGDGADPRTYMGAHDKFFRVAIAALANEALAPMGKRTKQALFGGEVYVLAFYDRPFRPHDHHRYRLVPEQNRLPYARAFALKDFLRKRETLVPGPARDDMDRRIRKLIRSFPTMKRSYMKPLNPRYRFDPATHVTALLLHSLQDARDKTFKVPDKFVEELVSELESVRHPHGSYGYEIDPEANKDGNDVLNGVVRSVLVEHALHRQGRSDATTLLKKIDRFLENRPGIKKIQDIPTKQTFGFYYEWHKGEHEWADYYLISGDLWTAAALADLPKAEAAKRAPALAEAILDFQASDGSWVDDVLLGPSYGTAAEIIALRHLKQKIQ